MSNSDYLKNIELMKEMGSPNGSDPIPPSQYLYFLDDPDPVQRVVAWTRSKTIRNGHRRPYAVDQTGTPLNIQNLADDCFNRDWANANRAWGAAVDQKLVARDAQDRLCLCGNVPPREVQRKALKKQSDTEGLPVCTNWLKLCTNWSLPDYVREDFEHLDPEQRETVAGEYLEFRKWADGIEADAMAAARAAIEVREKRFREERGLRWRGGKKRREEQPEGKTDSVQFKLLLEPPGSVHNGSVQDWAASSVQTQNGSLHNAEIPVVQKSHPIYLRDSERSSEEPVGRSVERLTTEETPTCLPTAPSSVEIIPDPRRDPAFREVIEVIEDVAVPVIGESPTDAQYLEIFAKLDGASPEQLRQRIEAKNARGELHSVMVLPFLALDCARSKNWRPPKTKAAAAPGRKNFIDSVDEAFIRRINEWGLRR